jgi:hypothetical protein
VARQAVTPCPEMWGPSTRFAGTGPPLDNAGLANRNGSWIRHARLGPALPVLPLAVAMIEPAFRTLLVPEVGATPLTPAGLVATGGAAITLSAIATRTEKEDHMTFTTQANPLPGNHFALTRHACSQAGLDNGNGSVAG